MNIAASTGYEKWNPGEPSNTSGNEDALYFINADNKQWEVDRVYNLELDLLVRLM